MKKQRKKAASARNTENAKCLYTLEVFLVNGPVTESFAKKNRVISRTIQIRGDQTLEDLHYAIFDAFDREEEHLYEFQMGGKGPMDPNARKYSQSEYTDDFLFGSGSAGYVENTTIGSLGLKLDESFGYWFDFGDDWMHQIDVTAIEEYAGRGKFPAVIKRTGESPPQYCYWDEDEDGFDDEEYEDDEE